MQDSGGRRIKRAVNIDMNSISFCNEEMLERFGKIQYISEYIETTRAELDLLKQQYGLLKPVACDEGELLVDKEGNQVEGCRESRELLEALPEKTHSSIA